MAGNHRLVGGIGRPFSPKNYSRIQFLRLYRERWALRIFRDLHWPPNRFDSVFCRFSIADRSASRKLRLLIQQQQLWLLSYTLLTSAYLLTRPGYNIKVPPFEVPVLPISSTATM